MNNRAFTISFVVAILAVLMVHSYVTSTEEQYKQRFGEEVMVVVAKEDIKELEALDETNLEEQLIPKMYVQAQRATSIAEFRGGLALGPIKKGEQITASRVATLGARTGLARRVSVDKRAITIRVNDESGVSKLIKPGDRVDILSAIDIDGGNKRLTEVRTVFQDVMILATGKFVTNTLPAIVERDPMKPSQKQTVNLSEFTNFANVTLEVTPEQAQSLVLLSNVLGGVYLSLRNNDDTRKLELTPTRVEQIVGPRGAIQPVAPAASPGQPRR